MRKYTDLEYNNPNQNMLRHECNRCHIEFFRPRDQVKDKLNGQKFCGYECYRRDKTENSIKKEFICQVCNTLFKRLESRFKATTGTFCSHKCQRKHLNSQRPPPPTKELPCDFCGKTLIKRLSAIKKHDKRNHKGHFCDRSCSSSYKARYLRPAKASLPEKYLQSKLIEKFPNLTFIFNGREAVGSELDIFIPSLKLAFEINGIFHYRAIFGDEALETIRSNDQRKIKACRKNKILLHSIDISKVKTTQDVLLNDKFTDIVDLINKRVAELPATPVATA